MSPRALPTRPVTTDAMPTVVERAQWQEKLDELLVREKAKDDSRPSRIAWSLEEKLRSGSSHAGLARRS